MPITAERCVELLRDALANRPADVWSQEFIDWHADVVGIVRAYSTAEAVPLSAMIPRITNPVGGVESMMGASMRANACTEFLAHARTIYTQLRLQTNRFQTAQVAQGAVHDYFEEIRQIIAGATREILFTDAYLDPSFVDRYMSQVPAGVTVRLLTTQGKGAALKAACTLYTQQHGTAIEVRAVPNQTLHDRHLVIDGRDVYQSGASFKDGGRHAPTSINQIVDVAADLVRAHDRVWNGASLVP